MDRRQWIVQRARELFGERLEDVVHMVRQALAVLPDHVHDILEALAEEFPRPLHVPLPTIHRTHSLR